MSKLWEKSNTVEFDNNGDRADGAIANFFVGGTTTPLSVYKDADETSPHETDVEADANGRWPSVFIPFVASYDVRVRTEGGTQLYYPTDIPNADPVEAAADTVDDEQLIATGGVIWYPESGTKSGYVRLNGRTIGNAASGATERANADTVDLFTYLYTKLADAQAAVSTGRGASAAADYAANKTIALLDGRSGILRGLDDMGNSAASRLGSTSFTNGNATTAGSVLGANTHALITAELATHLHTVSITSSSDGSHTHTGTVDSDGSHSHNISDPGHTHPALNGFTTGVSTAAANVNALVNAAATPANGMGFTATSNTSGITGTAAGGAHTHTFTSASNGAHTHTVSGNTGNNGSGTAHNNVSYGLLGTFYCKL